MLRCKLDGWGVPRSRRAGAWGLPLGCALWYRRVIMIAYDPTGTTLVLADGAELLVHDGPSEAPRWRCTGPAPLIAIGATAEAVVAVDGEGAVRWYDPHREVVQASVEVGAAVRAAAVAADGQVLVATAGGACVVGPGGHGLERAWPGACVVAWGPGGRSLVGDAEGKLGEFDADGGLVRSVPLGAPAVAATWNVQGFWVVATASKLLRVVEGTVHHLTNSPDMPVRAVACSGDGAGIGMQLGDALVLVMSWPERDTVGQVRYLDRSATGLAFGPAPWLAIGLDGGDGNKLNLDTGDLNRTDTHPGRTHRRWMAKVSVPQATAPAPTAARTAASPRGGPEGRAAYAPPMAAARTSTVQRVAVVVVAIAAIAVIAALAF